MQKEEYELKLNETLNKSIDQFTDEDRGILGVEWRLCSKSFTRFLGYCKIVEAPAPGQTSSGIIEFQITDHIKTFIHALLNRKLISVLKSRQIWISTTLSAYILWYALFHVGANVLLFSKGQLEARELLGKAKRIFNQLPEFLKQKPDPESFEEMGFPTMKSTIRALPSTTSAGIGFTASIIVCDEHAEHEYAEENYVSAKPTIDRGGQFISVFTENAWNKDNLATVLYEDGKEDKNGFISIFFPFNVVPNRDEEWYQAVRNSIPDRELAGLTPELYMYKNYPRSEEEALSVPQTVAAFDKKVLENMLEVANRTNSVTIEHEGIDYEYCNIYLPFHLGDFFVVASDVSLGVGRDYNVTTIMNVKTGVIVADIVTNTLDPDEFAWHTIRLLEAYKNPKWWPEENLWGKRVIKVAQDLKYTNLQYRDERRTKAGFVTDEKTRKDLFAGLIPAVDNRQITILNPKGVLQLMDLIRNADKNGRIEARSTGHDDYPIAAGICWLKKDTVSVGLSPPKPIHTLTFGSKEEGIMDRVKELEVSRQKSAPDDM